jgi:hypothetical protein
MSRQTLTMQERMAAATKIRRAVAQNAIPDFAFDGTENTVTVTTHMWGPKASEWLKAQGLECSHHVARSLFETTFAAEEWKLRLLKPQRAQHLPFTYGYWVVTRAPNVPAVYYGPLRSYDLAYRYLATFSVDSNPAIIEVRAPEGGYDED